MYRDVFPCLFNTSVKFSNIGRVFFPFTNAFLDYGPQILNWIKIRALSGPWKYVQIISVWNLFATFDVWGRALSSWNQPSPFGNARLIVGMTYFWRMMTCEAPVAVPDNGTMGPTPCLEKHPQCIRLGLCFTVADTQELSHSSFGSRHTLLQCWYGTMSKENFNVLDMSWTLSRTCPVQRSKCPVQISHYTPL